jgi:L-lactate dehydrogenase (cytochrome)
MEGRIPGEAMRLQDCHNFSDFRNLARRKVPRAIFDYIDGGADDEISKRRNAASVEACDLVPYILRGVGEVDLSVTVMGQRLELPVYLSPTALQRVFHPEGELAAGAAAARFGTMFGVSSIGTVSVQAVRALGTNPQCYQFYFHRDRGLNRAMMQAAREAGIEVMMLTVDSITGGNRERDKRSGFGIPFRPKAGAMLNFALRPTWALRYLRNPRISLPQLDAHVSLGGSVMTISRYFTEMLDPDMNWDDVAAMVAEWGGPFCLKGVMAPEDALRAAEIGCNGIILSNHSGRQLDGTRAPFDQLAEVVDAAGDRLDVLVDGGFTRGTHVLKALALGAKAVGLGSYYLFALAVAGRPGVERAMELMREELARSMRLMGARRVSDLTRANLRFRETFGH